MLSKKLIKAELNEEFAKANGHDTVEAFKEAKKAELVEAEKQKRTRICWKINRKNCSKYWSSCT